MKRALPAFLLAACAGCAVVGQGQGQVHSDLLLAEDCWAGPFDLDPNFFASIPFRNTQQIRVQRGSDLPEVSDGLEVLVNDTAGIRSASLDSPVEVGLAPRLLNKIAPGIAVGAPPRVSMSLYLEYSCHNENEALYSLSGSITFQALFNGDPNEATGADKLTVASLDVMMADPRDAIAGTLTVPKEKQTHLTGSFKFFFERGQPGQPFP